MNVVKVVLSILFVLFCIYANAQNKKTDTLNLGFRINSGMHNNIPPLYFLNGNVFDGNLTQLNPDTIGVIFAEGDSSYVSRTYGDSPDTSLIRQYFGEQRNRGILFIFTKDKVQTLSQKKLRQCIKDEKCNMVFKVNNVPLTNSLGELDLNHIDKIQMVKDFKLTKWDTREEDVFTLFVIETKK